MGIGKMVFYDWAGGNKTLFKVINTDGGETYNNVMILISRLTDYKNFPYSLYCYAFVPL